MIGVKCKLSRDGALWVLFVFQVRVCAYACVGGWFFKTGFLCIALEPGLELALVHLPLPPECWD